MAEFCATSKSSQQYLDTAANGNGHEKALFATEALRRLKLAGKEAVHLTEIGPGGGAAVDTLVQKIGAGRDMYPQDMSFSFVELDGVESQSLAHARQRLDAIGPSEMFAGDAKYLDTVVDRQPDVITASAVFHEIYSYAGGYGAVTSTIDGISRALHPGGYFSYRDVFSVDRLSQHERVTHVYDHEGWVRFAVQFLPHYLAEACHPYHREDDDIKLHQDSKYLNFDSINPEKALSINAPVGLLRELQRHYITFRDHVWRAGAIGLTPILEGDRASDWLDIKRGHKRVYFRSTAQDLLLNAMSEECLDGTRVVDSDMFDATSDALLNEFLKQAECAGSTQRATWLDWLKREGSETYTYMTAGRFIGAVARRSIEVNDGKTVLLPQRSEDVRVAPRAYYNRFLEQQLINPLRDGKQLILFKNIDIRRDPRAISEGLHVVSQVCPRDILVDIYEPVTKVLR